MRRRNRRSKEARSDDLLSAARDVFVEKGFAAARIEDVAARADVSKGTAYLYFDSKEALFRAVIESGLLPVTEAIAALELLEDRPAAELLGRYFDAWKSIAGDTAVGSSLKLLIAESGNFPDVACRFDHAIVCVARNAMVRIIEAGIASGNFRPVQPDIVADLFLATIWLSATGYPSGRHPSPEGLLEGILDILTHGLFQHPQVQ